MSSKTRGLALGAGAVLVATLMGVVVAFTVRPDPSTIQVDDTASDEGSVPVDGGERADRGERAGGDELSDGGDRADVLPGDLYVSKYSPQVQWLSQAGDDPRSAVIGKTIATQPTAFWFGPWSKDLSADVANLVADAEAADATPVTVLRRAGDWDCDSSPDSPKQAQALLDDAAQFASGIGDASAIVLVEPGLLDQVDCLSQAQWEVRASALAGIMALFRAEVPNALTYLDAGPDQEATPEQMAARLDAAGLESARGFAVNLSGLANDDAMDEYADQINATLQEKFGYQKPYVIDSGRNGTDVEELSGYCNPPEARIGRPPGEGLAEDGPELLLWVKVPGESDGNCGAGKGSEVGEFVPDLAVAMVEGRS
ncbi:MAG: glycoside hydrolase family 6 protein [Nocardioides sp.]